MQPAPVLSMLEWLCTQLMEVEIDQQPGAEKSERIDSRSGYRSGCRPRCLDTRMGTIYLMAPKVRQGDYILFFVTERKHSEAALIQFVQEFFLRTSLDTIMLNVLLPQNDVILNQLLFLCIKQPFAE